MIRVKVLNKEYVLPEGEHVFLHFDTDNLSESVSYDEQYLLVIKDFSATEENILRRGTLPEIEALVSKINRMVDIYRKIDHLAKYEGVECDHLIIIK